MIQNYRGLGVEHSRQKRGFMVGWASPICSFAYFSEGSKTITIFFQVFSDLYGSTSVSLWITWNVWEKNATNAAHFYPDANSNHVYGMYTCIKLTKSVNRFLVSCINLFYGKFWLPTPSNECRTKARRTKAPRTETPWIKVPKTKPPRDKS